MRDSGFHPFKGRVSRHFGETVRYMAAVFGERRLLVWRVLELTDYV